VGKGEAILADDERCIDWAVVSSSTWQNLLGRTPTTACGVLRSLLAACTAQGEVVTAGIEDSGERVAGEWGRSFTPHSKGLMFYLATSAQLL